MGGTLLHLDQREVLDLVNHHYHETVMYAAVWSSGLFS